MTGAPPVTVVPLKFMKPLVLFSFLSLLAHATAAAGVVGKEVTYTAGDTTLKGYLAHDDESGDKRPGVLVVHEWWGHNDYARKRARMLAELGYVALAVDMYGEGKQASHPEDAGKFSNAVMQNTAEGRARFEAAMKLLQDHAQSDPGKIGAIGYCFGGAVVLHMARFGVPLRGVVSFHGSLGTATPAKSGEVTAKVLVCHGADDPFIPPEKVQAFKDEMEKAGVDYRFESYPGAVHSFTNPDADKFGKEFSIPLAYHPEADSKSWATMKSFFEDVFRD